MKRKIRNSLLLVLSLILAFAMAVGVSASEPTYSITISNAAGQQTYTVYKVFDATYSSAGTSYTIDSTTNPWYDLVSTTGSPFTLTPTAADPDVYVVTVANTISSSDISDWFESLTDSQLQSVSSTIVGTQTSSVNAGETETLTFDLDGTNAGAGYYFITTTLGSLVTVDTANPKATVQEKNGVPSVEKQVSNDGSAYSSSNTAAIGDTVYFKSTITNFAGTYDLKVLVDNMDMGLTLNTSSIEVTYYANANDTSGTTLTSNVTIDTTNSADGKFSIDFSSIMSSSPISSATDESYIVITYSATVNGDGTTIAYNNETYVTYGSSETHSTSSKTTTYVSKFTLNKVNSSQTTISGAVFFLYDSDNNLLYFTKSGDVYTLASSTATSATAEIEAGNVTIFGLDVGTYTLTETTAPDGYNKLTSSVTIVISATYDSNGKINGMTMSYEYETESETDQTEIDVVNNTGSEMPSTGGIGTTIFYVVGAVLVLLAIVLLITRWMVGRREQQ